MKKTKSKPSRTLEFDEHVQEKGNNIKLGDRSSVRAKTIATITDSIQLKDYLENQVELAD